MLKDNVKSLKFLMFFYLPDYMKIFYAIIQKIAERFILLDYGHMKVVKLGVINYLEAYKLQEMIHQNVFEEKMGNTLLILEHEPVYTIGISGNRDNILVSEEYLKKNNIEVHHIRRGGDVTYHGPGQIVGYPIFNLNHLGKNVRKYVSHLENTIINLLKEEYVIKAESNPAFPGVWVEDRKITAVGSRIRHGVSMHGFAFNVNTDLDFFKLIIPCGIHDKEVTSLEHELGGKQDMDMVMRQVIDNLAREFNLDFQIIDKEEFLNSLK